MSQHELLLAEFIVEENFGSTAKTVTSELIKKQQLSLQQLCFYCKFPLKQVKETIFVLVQHAIVNWEERMDVGAGGKISTLYSVSLANIFVRSLFPCLLNYVARWFEDSSSMLAALKHTFLSGTVPYGWFSQSPELEGALKRLLKERLLRSPAAYAASPKEEAGPAMGKKKRKLSVQEALPKAKRQNLNVIDDLEAEESFPANSYFRINYKSFVDLMRYERVVSYFRSKYNQSTADIVNFIFKIHFQSDCSGSASLFALNQLVHGSVFLSPFDRKSQSSSSTVEGVNQQLFGDYLDLICDDSSKIFNKKDGIILLNERAISHHVQSAAFQSLVRERFGSGALRIFNLLAMSKNSLDDKLISKHALLPLKDVRELLFKLVKYGAISSQEVPRTADHVPSKTWFLWTFARGTMLKSVLDHLVHAIYNVCRIIQLEYSNNSLLLEKTQRIDVQENPALLSEPERQALKNVFSVLNQLEFLYISSLQEAFVMEGSFSSTFPLPNVFSWQGKSMASEHEGPYYLRAFQWIIQQAISIPKYSDLLREEEKTLIRKFSTDLSEEPQRLWLRLFLRKSRKSFPIASVLEDYGQEFPAVSELIGKCLELGFLQIHQDLESILRHSLRRTQLNSLFSEVFCGRSIPVLKEQLVSSLIDYERSCTNSAILKPSLRQTKLFFVPQSNKIGFQSEARKSVSEHVRSKFGQFIGLNWQKEFYQICMIVLLPAVSFGNNKLSLEGLSISPSALLECVIMSQLDRAKYPTFAIEEKRGIFVERKEFDDYFEMLTLYHLLGGLLQESKSSQNQNLSAVVLFFLPELYERLNLSTRAISLDKFTLDYLIAKILNLVASFYEKQKEYKKANRIYKDLLFTNNPIHKRMLQRENWWKRLCVNTRTHLADVSGYLALQDGLFSDPSLPEYFLQEMRGIDGNDLPVRELEMAEDYVPASFGKSRVTLLNEKGAKFTVEDYVLQLYEDEGWQGIHCEGTVLTMVAVLLSWDVLFDSKAAPETFQSQFQTFPLDLFTLDFYQKRATLLNSHFTQFVEQPLTIKLLLETNYFKYKGTNCIGIDWNISWEVCEAFALGVGKIALVSMMKWILMDYRRMTSGFPDLFLWQRTLKSHHRSESKKFDVLFLEVKSHNDTLSNKQIYWIKRMLNLNLNVQIIKIRKI